MRFDWEREVVVVGAGAAGLWAAAVAGRRGAQVLVLEKTPRTGTKVLASGGTRCNLTTTLDGPRAGALFGERGARFLEPALRALDPARLRQRFEDMGVPTEQAALEKVFPRSGRARDVRDALEREARSAGAEIALGAGVRAVIPGERGWLVHVQGDRCALAQRLVLASGGKSYARTGTTGEGYRWLAELGLELVEPRPALVPLTSPEPWVRGLTGIALQDCEVRLEDPQGRRLARRRRPLLFTHKGLSGPAAMDVSREVSRLPEGVPARLCLDLLPGRSREDLRQAWIDGARRSGGGSTGRLLGQFVPRRLGDELARQASLLDVRRPASEVSRAERHGLVERLKGLQVTIDGTLGFDHAEVTAGGLALSALEPGTMAVRGRPGLFVCGELLDLDGPIGGLNFQAAFSSAELAGRAAAQPG